MYDAPTDHKIFFTNIQRFSLHDGPGIRTTVFLKGCSLHCPWCCNPENIAWERQEYCREGKKGMYGKYITCDELYKEIMKDYDFYESDTQGNQRDACYTTGYHINKADMLNDLPGGVTFSGGEPLLQISNLVPLLKRLGAKKIHRAVETSLFVHPEQVRQALLFFDLFYIDIKIMDASMCCKVLGGDLETYLNNLSFVFSYRYEDGKNVPIIFRLPVIGGYTDIEENCEKILELISDYRPIKVELIKGHNLGAPKYATLSMAEPEYKNVDDRFLEKYKQKIINMSIPAQICRA